MAEKVSGIKDVQWRFAVMLDDCEQTLLEMRRNLELLEQLDSQYLDCRFYDRIQAMNAELALTKMECEELGSSIHQFWQKSQHRQQPQFSSD